MFDSVLITLKIHNNFINIIVRISEQFFILKND